MESNECKTDLICNLALQFGIYVVRVYGGNGLLSSVATICILKKYATYMYIYLYTSGLRGETLILYCLIQ